MSIINNHAKSTQGLYPHNQPKSEEPTQTIKVNNLSAAVVGFISRILTERTFFQNTQIPADTLLYLANDLIKTVTPPQKRTFGVIKEGAIAFKYYITGQELSQEEKNYSNFLAKKIDVPGEIFNGLRYSSMALMGQGLYQSLTSAVSQNLWNHVPSICGYFGVAIGGAQAVAYAVNQTLQKTKLSDEQKALVEPWLNTLGRFALGFVPKVHATENGVHYHYPSTQGYSQTISSDQTVTAYGDIIMIEKEGSFDTPNGTFDGVHEAEFKLGEIYELNEVRVRIQVLDKDGTPVPVTFTKIHGQYGPEVIVTSENKALELEWSKYFLPKLKALPMPNQEKVELYDGLSCKNEVALDLQRTLLKEPIDPINSLYLPNLKDSNFAFMSTLFVIAGLGLGRNSPLTGVLGGLLAISQAKGVEAGPLINFAFPTFSLSRVAMLLTSIFAQKAAGGLFSNPLKKAAREGGHQAQLVLNRGNQIIDGAITRLTGLEEKFMVDFGEMGKLLIEEAGEEFRITAKELTKDITEGAEAVLKVAGYEARFTVEAVGKEVKEIAWHAGEQARLTIKEGENSFRTVMADAEMHGNKMILKVGEEGRLTIEKAGDVFRLTADETLKKFFSGGEVLLNVAGEELRLTITPECHLFRCIA